MLCMGFVLAQAECHSLWPVQWELIVLPAFAHSVWMTMYMQHWMHGFSHKFNLCVCVCVLTGRNEVCVDWPTDAEIDIRTVHCARLFGCKCLCVCCFA